MVKRFSSLGLAIVLACGMMFGLTGCSSEPYKPEEKTPSISTPAIGKAGYLRVGVNTSNAPFAGQSSGKISGLDVDIAAAIADSLGLKLEIVDVGSTVDTALKDDTVDIVMSVDKTDSAVKNWRSEPYAESSIALFAASADTAVPTKKSNPKIAAQTGSMSAWEVTNQFGSSALTPASDLKTAFSQIGSGSVEYVAADALVGSYAIQIGGGEAYIIALLQEPSGYCIAALDSNTELQMAIEGALKALQSDGILTVIESKWLGSSIDLTSIALTEGAKNANKASSDDTKEEEEESSETEEGTGTGTSGTGTNGTGTGGTEEGTDTGTNGTGTDAETAGGNAASPTEDAA